MGFKNLLRRFGNIGHSNEDIHDVAFNEEVVGSITELIPRVRSSSRWFPLPGLLQLLERYRVNWG